MASSRFAGAAVALLAVAAAAQPPPPLPDFVVAPPAPPRGTFIAKVSDYGGRGDGLTLNTAAIQAALADVAAHGGGTVYVGPGGVWLTSPFNLSASPGASDVTLYLDGAVLTATQDFSKWQIVSPLPTYGRGRDFPGPRYEALVSCYNCSRVAVRGNPEAPTPAIVDGGGAAWWDSVKNGSLTVTPGHLVEFLYSQDVEVHNVTLVDSPFWNLHLYMSARVWVHDYTVRAPQDSTNTDGVDPDSSVDVLVENYDAATGDDCVAVKAGWAPWAMAYDAPTRRVEVRNMTCHTGGAACIAVGSEMSGGVYDVRAVDITCNNAGQLLNVKSALGRGGAVANISMENSRVGGLGFVNVVIAVADTYHDQYPPAPINPAFIPLLGPVFVTNVTARVPASISSRPGEFSGLGPTPVSGQVNGVFLTNVDLAPGMGPSTSSWLCANATGAGFGFVTPPLCGAFAPPAPAAAPAAAAAGFA